MDRDTTPPGGWFPVSVPGVRPERRLTQLPVLVASVFLFLAPIFAAAAPERRVDQYPTENDGYLIVPLPYSIPGIGEGMFLMGYFTNIFNTTADAFAVKLVGDAEGYVAQADEVPIFKKNLFLNLTGQRIDKAVVNNYKTRGMKNGKDDYNLIEMSQADGTQIGLTWSLFDRRLEINSTHSRFTGSVTALRDPDGNIISTLDPPYKFANSDWMHSLKIDLTDDYLDPRRGVRFDLHYQDKPAETANDPDYYQVDAGASLYIPVRQHDTLALNYYRSDAHVTRTGNTDPNAIRAELGTKCALTDTVCILAETEVVNNFISERTYGTANSLGGDNRLRAYPQGRFSGAHMAFVGAEYRWNFVQDAKPFDYFIWKDVTTTLQLAFFYEAGTVSEVSSDLWDEYRTSYGIGGRLLSASGSVYRAEVARGDEGNQVIVFFFYPWK